MKLEPRWMAPWTGLVVPFAPPVSRDHEIYARVGQGVLVVDASTGAKQMTRDLGASGGQGTVSCLPLPDGGLVTDTYPAPRTYGLACLRRDGTTRWEQAVGRRLTSAPTLDGGVIVVGVEASGGRECLRISTDTGEVVAREPLAERFPGVPKPPRGHLGGCRERRGDVAIGITNELVDDQPRATVIAWSVASGGELWHVPDSSHALAFDGDTALLLARSGSSEWIERRDVRSGDRLWRSSALPRHDVGSLHVAGSLVMYRLSSVSHFLDLHDGTSVISMADAWGPPLVEGRQVALVGPCGLYGFDIVDGTPA